MFTFFFNQPFPAIFYNILWLFFCFLLSSMSWRIRERGIFPVNRWQDHMTLFFWWGLTFNGGRYFLRGDKWGEGTVRDDLLEDISPLLSPTRASKFSMHLWARKFWYVARGNLVSLVDLNMLRYRTLIPCLNGIKSLIFVSG